MLHTGTQERGKHVYQLDLAALGVKSTALSITGECVQQISLYCMESWRKCVEDFK